jgi:FkbM family methyltransferase
MLHCEFIESSLTDNIINGDLITRFDNKTVTTKYELSNNHFLQRSLYHNTKNNLTYEPDFTTIIFKVLKPGDTFIDIGANFGYFSLLASSFVGEEGHVFSFEPETYNFNCLTNNINLNKNSNITTFNIALGNVERNSFLYLDKVNDGGHTLWGIRKESIDKIGEHEPEKQMIHEVPLDNVVFDKSFSSIKILKIDAEGWDHNILMGAVNTIKRFNIPIILAEVYVEGLERSGSSERIYRRFMKELGYNMYIAHPTSQGGTFLELVDDNRILGNAYNAIFSSTQHLAPYTQCCHFFV